MGSDLPRRRFFFLLLATLAAAALSACTVPEAVLENRACDGTHPCSSGYRCVSGRCLADGTGDGGTALVDGGVEACNGSGQRACGTDEGECSQGTQTCEAGVWSACQGGTGPDTEVCDDKDNDCDGDTDEESDLVLPPCPLQQGVCAGSHKDCFGGEEQACDALSYEVDYEEGSETSCDGLDNDCDGKTDEGLDDDGDGWGVDVACVHGSGDCDDWDPAANPGAEELCNGHDDDCNGEADDGASMTCVALSASTQACSLGTGDAGALDGVQTCNNLCSAFECKPFPEVCNGVDDDLDGATDEDLALHWVRFDVTAGKPASPRIAGVPGLGFTAAWRVPDGSGEVLMSRVSSTGALKEKAPVAAAAGATGPLAVTASHVVWAETGGVRARALHGGLPAGSPLTVTTSVDLLAALDWDVAAAKSLVAVASGTSLKAVTLTAGASAAISGDFPSLSSSTALALARLDGANALVVYRSGTELKAVQAGAAFGEVYPFLPAGTFLDMDGPAGAGRAVVFHASRSGGKNGIYIGRTLDSPLSSEAWTALTEGSDPTSAPALAALGDDEYQAAWLETPSGARTVVNTARIRWTGTAWTSASTVTGLFNKDDATALPLAVATGTDGQRYMVLFQTFGTGDDLLGRTNCPAGL